MFVSPPIAWRRLRDMRDVVRTQQDVAHAVWCLSLYDQLDLDAASGMRQRLVGANIEYGQPTQMDGETSSRLTS
jgi:hypothetical protein